MLIMPYNILLKKPKIIAFHSSQFTLGRIWLFPIVFALQFVKWNVKWV